MRILILVAVIAAASAAAEKPSDQGGSKVKAVRTALPEKAGRSADSVLDHYDFGSQLNVLMDTNGLTPAAPPPPAATAAPGVTAPKGYRPKTDVSLTPASEVAVGLSEKWSASGNEPLAGPDGRVLYSYGSGLPTVVCAPLRVCIIELQAGEKLVGEPQIGDSVRWNLSPAMYGRGDDATAVIVLKPQSPGLDTNLLVTTDRRAYYLRLISKPDDYVARIAFAYPEEDAGRKWQEHLIHQREEERRAARQNDTTLAAVSAEKMCFEYSVKGGDESTHPIRVFDDGAKTYIQMPAAIKNREAPVLVVLGEDGKGEMVNYRVKDQMYVVDRIFDRAQLVLGTGKKARKVEISRERKG